MELVERDEHVSELSALYKRTEGGVGHTAFIMGGAGEGKTSLVNHFLKSVEGSSKIYIGACDSLYTPRPLGPLYDVAEQLGKGFLDILKIEKDRSLLFATLVREISSVSLPVILVFEDVHWADEATLDLIKFLARRVKRLKCLFIVTYRHDDVNAQARMVNIYSELPPGVFTKLEVKSLSYDAVNQLAIARGYESGERIYSLTSGNAFFVAEILASYSPGIPDRIKDSILAVFNKVDEKTRSVWEILSVLPSRNNLNLIRYVADDFAGMVTQCTTLGIINYDFDHFAFKHELYRIIIEESLSAEKKKRLHKQILQIMRANPAEFTNLSELVHHARLAGERKLVAELAQKAAVKAASVGSHIEASKLYLAAIDNADKDGNNDDLILLYEKYAYECYLTNQIETAISSQQRLLELCREKKLAVKEGDALRFLSRLWWFEGNHLKAKSYALESIEVLKDLPPSREQALAYSNLSQLYMLEDDADDGLLWGYKAINLATSLDDRDILAHALTNVGAILMKSADTEGEGEAKLNRSLSIALANGFHDHAARAYANIISSAVLIRKYEKAEETYVKGTKYCEERDLSAMTYFLEEWRARMLLDTGAWTEAERIAENISRCKFHVVKSGALVTLARIRMRRGDFDQAITLIREAKRLAMPTQEVQRIIPVIAAELELHWLNNTPFSFADLNYVVNELFPAKSNSWHFGELAYWMKQNSIRQPEDNIQFTGPYDAEMNGKWAIAAASWRKLGCPYEEALALCHGNRRDLRMAVDLLDKLGAKGTQSKIRLKLKQMGMKNIPRGPHESTRQNPSNLTNRQIHVLQLLKHGLQNTEIADKLFISRKTVDHHISAILSKLEVKSRTKAVFEAEKLGIIT